MRTDFTGGDLTGAGPNRKSTPANLTDAACDRPLPAPLQYWRSLPVTTVSNELLETVAEVLSRLAIMGEPDFQDAIAGAATTAVGIALRVTKDAEATNGRIDIAMTALLRPAFEGNAGAALVLASIIKRMVAGADGQLLAEGWLKRGRLLPDKPCRLSTLTISEPANERG